MSSLPVRRTLHVRSLIIFVVGIVAFGTATHFLHRFQIRRHASSLLREAARAEEAKEPEKAREFLTRYLGLIPNDREARARYALLLDQLATTPEARQFAFLALESGVRLNSDRADLRRHAAELALTLGRPNDAREHLAILLQSNPNDAELHDMMGRSEEASQHFAEARIEYAKSLSLAPERVETATRLARLLRGRLGQPNEADRVMDALVGAAPDGLEPRVARARYLRKSGKLEEAARDFAYARDKLHSTDAELLLSSSELAEALGKTGDARKLLEQGAALHADDLRFGVSLVRLDLRPGGAGRNQAINRLRLLLPKVTDKTEEAWAVADLFIDANELPDAKALLTRLTADGALPAPVLVFVKARLLACEHRLGDAVVAMERARVDLGNRPELARRADLLLADWYAALGNADGQLAACDRVLTIDPHSGLARAGKAAALSALGRPEAALDQYRALIPESPGLRLPAVRQLIVRNLRLPAERREWTEAEQLLRDAPDDVKARPEHRLLMLDLLALTGKTGEALVSAVAACSEKPREISYWLARAALAELGVGPKDKPDPARALAVLDEALVKAGDSVDLRLARASRLIAIPSETTRPQLQQLQPKSEEFSAAERGRLLAGLGLAWQRLGDFGDAKLLLDEAAQLLPDDLVIRLEQFDLAVSANDESSAAQVTEATRRIEGEEGTLWRYQEAARRVLSAKHGDRSRLGEARVHISEAAKRRPNWGRLAALEGEIADLEGDSDAALTKYRLAIDRGERGLGVVRRAVRLLASRRRTDEARQLLLQFLDKVPTGTNDWQRLYVEVTLDDRANRKEALELARAAVPADAKDFRDHLWLGQVLASLGELTQAEAALRKAVELKPNAAEPWTALVAVLIDAGRKDAAKVELERAKQALPLVLRDLVLAPGKEMLGLTDEAEDIYRGLLTARPDDAAIKRATATFYLRTGQAGKAEPILRTLAKSSGPEAVWARRSMALEILLRTDDYAKSREALALIDANLFANPSSLEDKRARALVLARRPSDRAASIKALEEWFAKVKPTVAEQFLLAQLYDADNNWSKANELGVALVSAQGSKNPDHLAWYVGALLRHDLPSEAASWQRRLEAVEPGSWRTTELQARLLFASNDARGAADLLKSFASQKFAQAKDAQVFASAANLLAQFGMPQEAEVLFRRYTAEMPNKPESVLLQAAFLARTGRVSAALDIADKVGTAAPDETAAVVVAFLRAEEPSAANNERVRLWLEAAAQRKPNSLAILAARGDFLDLVGDYAGAEKLYRELLSKDARSVLALNNLAWLLAVRDGRGSESLELIERGLAIAGPSADLLDTRATVFLALNQPQRAITDLEAALHEAPNAVRHYHLAQALAKAGNLEAALASWKKATRELSLKENQLHPLERAAFRKFGAELASR